MKFRAAVLAKSREPLIVDEIHFPGPLAPGQVLVRIEFSGICGAQVNEIDAAKGPDRFLPHLLGHEGVGEVVEVGPLVSSVRPGDTVVLHWMVGEGVQSNPGAFEWRGKRLNAGWVTTLGEYTVASENRVTKVSSSLDSRYLPLFGCAATTAWGSLVNDVGLRLGESAVILGVGGVGLLTVEAARAGGAHPIVAVDRHEERLEIAQSLGAQTTLMSDQPELEALIRQSVGERSCDVIVETTGAREMIELAYRLAADGGRAVLVGVPRHDEPVSLDSLALHFGMTFTGSKGGSVSPEIDIPRLIDLAEAGLYRVTSLPITELPLEEVNFGIEAIRTGQPGRILINMK